MLHVFYAQLGSFVVENVCANAKYNYYILYAETRREEPEPEPARVSVYYAFGFMLMVEYRY